MYRSLVLLLITIFVHSINSNSFNRSALCFLTRKARNEISEFAEQLAKTVRSNNIDIFIMIDDNQFDVSSLTNTSSSVEYLQISNDLCVKYGYENTTSLGNGWSSITSWDKALLYFAFLNSNYSFVWFVEDDVFIPNVQSFLSLHLLYSMTTDLIVPRNGFNLQGETSTWLWPMALRFFAPPWSCSMVNVIGLSRLMLDTIDDYVQWRGEVPFHEFFFNTLALQKNFTIRTPIELSTIVYRDSYSYEQISQQPNNFWHPMKNLSQVQQWRQRLINETGKNFSRLNITDLPKLCSANETDDDLQEFFDDFPQTKSFYSRSDRLFLHEYFLSSYKKCQKANRSTNILSYLQQLADHAYRLPEISIDELIKEKNDQQRKLEDELQKNQEKVLEILSQNETNRSLIVQLRKRATILTRQLTREIQNQLKKKSSSQSTTSSSSSTSSTLTSTIRTTTDTSTEIFHPIALTPNRFSFVLSRGNPSPTNEQTNSDLKIIFILFSLSFFTFLILCWKRVEERQYLIYVMIYLSFMSLCYMI